MDGGCCCTRHGQPPKLSEAHRQLGSASTEHILAAIRSLRYNALNLGWTTRSPLNGNAPRQGHEHDARIEKRPGFSYAAIVLPGHPDRLGGLLPARRGSIASRRVMHPAEPL